MEENNKSLINLDDLTLKQRRWLKAYIQTGNATEAARQAGYQCESEHSYWQIGYENLRKLEVKELMEGMGITQRALLGSLAQGITKPTKKVQRKMIQYEEVPAEGDVRYYKDKKGRLVLVGTKTITEFEYEDIPDYEERRKATETALKLNRSLNPPQTPAGNTQVNVGNATIQVVSYADESPKEIIEATPIDQVDQN